jgi:putative transcriptional regulator
MKTTRHPGADSLMSCSAGSMPEAFAAVMATHMTMCPDCQHDLSIMESIGTALFEQLSGTAIAHPAPVAAIRSLEADVEPAPESRAAASGDMPATLVAAVGPSLDTVPWKRLSIGVWQHRIPLSKGATGNLRLIKVAPGQALPEHSHRGSELTLVLRGSYTDTTGRYAVGDVADLDDSVVHSPVADAVEGCICLIATQGRMKFKSPFARLVQPFTGF